ncbi:MAG: hypothetical protein SOX77_00350, partial [Candidatus Borkfalkiaceae bacterium]|nr:hypothetical protein [Christensenellaceae bacterium]
VVDGTVTNPVFNDLAKVGGDGSLIAQVKDLLEKEFNVTDVTVLKAISELNGIYAGTTIKSFVSDSKLIKINDVTVSLGEVVKTIKGVDEKATLIGRAITLVNTVIGGTVTKPVFNDMAKVGGDDGLILQVKGFVEDAKFNADVKAVVLKAFDEIAELYETATINSFVKYTNSLKIASITEAAGEIVKAVKGANEKESLIDKSVALVNTLISGRVSKPLFNDLAKVGDDDGLIMQAKGIIGEFKLNEKVKAVVEKALDEAAGIYETTTIKTFVNDSKNIEIDSLIEAVKQIVRTAVGEEKFDKSNAGKYFDVLAIAISGTVSKPTFSFEDAWNDERLTQTDKIVIGAVAVGSGLFAYYALNDTLVSLVKKTYGEKTLGEVVGKTLGYTLNESGDWNVGGVVNELTNGMFKVKAYTFVNKSQYDIVENAKQNLTIGNVLGIAKQTLNGVNNALPEYEAADGTKTKLKLTKNASGEWTLGLKELDAVITLILNAKYDDIVDYAKADKAGKPETTIGKRIDALTVSDLGVGFAIAKLATSGLSGKAGLDITVSYDTTTGKWTYASKNGGKGTYVTICDVIFNTSVKEVREALDGSGAKVLVKRWISRLTFGDVLGDSLLAIGGSNYSDYLNGIGAEYVGGKWVAKGKYKTLNGNLLNLGIYDAAKALKTADGIDGLLKLVLKDVYAGELFGRTISKNEETEEISWYDEEGNLIDFNTMNRGALSKVISNVSLLEFMENDFDIGSIIDDMLIGEIMDFVCVYTESTSGEYVLDTENNKYVKATAETPADAQRYSRVWTDHEGNVQDSSILLIMLNYTVKELCDSNLEESLKEKINAIKVSEILGDYNEPGNKIFHTLTEEEYQAVTIGELSDVMYNSLQTASLQTLSDVGLFRDGMFDDGQPLGLLNDYSVIKEDGTEEVVGIAGINMSNLDTAVTQCINKANVGKLLGVGILPLSTENQEKLDALFGENVWKEKTLDTLITDILDRIPASITP